MLPSKTSFMPLPIWLYTVLWFLFVYLFVSIIFFQVDQPNNVIVSGMYFVEFGVHEISHLAVFFLPPILVAAAGSVGEIAFTVLLLAAALKSRSYFAAVFAGLWIMLAMQSVGRYMADAKPQLIPLAGPSDAPQHDWNYVFSQLGWLDSSVVIGNTVRGFGILIGFTALALGLWLMFKKITN